MFMFLLQDVGVICVYIACTCKYKHNIIEWEPQILYNIKIKKNVITFTTIEFGKKMTISFSQKKNNNVS